MSRLPVKAFQGIALIALSVTQPAFSRVRTNPEGFYITLPVNYDTLLGVMREVCSDGIIHGTFQYENETEITGAEAATTGPRAISPAHFVGSNDQGSITVRYVVEPVSPANARISIDAVFVEDSGHHRHISQGLVETREFREIAQRLKALEPQKKASQVEARIHAEKVEWENYAAKLKELQLVVESEKTHLASATVEVQDMQTRLRLLRRQVLARVKVPGAELKALPFLHAATLASVPGGTVVHTSQRTEYWYRVQISGVGEGWFYRSLLEDLP